MKHAPARVANPVLAEHFAHQARKQLGEARGIRGNAPLTDKRLTQEQLPRIVHSRTGSVHPVQLFEGSHQGVTGINLKYALARGQLVPCPAQHAFHVVRIGTLVAHQDGRGILQS